MALYVNTNVASLDAQKNLARTQIALAVNLARISSGLRINNASDDAAGLGISEKLRAAIRTSQQAARNSNDGISMIQVGEGAMNEQAGILIRLRELATESANGTLGTTERTFVDAEAKQLVLEIDRISNTTEFNGVFMLSTGTTTTMQVGIHATANDVIAVSFSVTNSTSLSVRYGVGNQVDLTTQTTSQAALTNIDAGINALSTARATIGAQQNRLQVTITNLASTVTNLAAANSRIRDTDVAEESSALTRNQILSQAGIATLAQANQIPQAALSLIGGGH